MVANPHGGADPEAQAGIERNRRVGLFALSALLAVIGALLAKLNLVAQLNVANVPAVAGYIITGLLVASGADPIRELLKQRSGDREARESPPIQVSGTLILRQEPGQHP
jgi:hypothetical protein